MPTIEKIQETWTPTSITTLFRLCSKATIACSLPLTSPIAGRSWSLLLRAPTVTKAKLPGKLKKGVRGPLMCQLFFKFSNCDSAWHGAPVNITLSFPSHPDGDIGNSPLSATSAALVLKYGDLHPLVTYSTDDLGDALVSLEVAFTSLQTCNPFDVLAHVDPVPRAPTSANEPSAPQARTALRALERSFKTGTSFDIIFQAYTRRLSPGKVTRPIPIYASTTVLQATTLLPDFVEEDLSFSSLFELPEGDPLFTSPESYEYESDSDLDDEEGDDLAAVQSAEQLATGGEACHDPESHTSAPDAQLHEDSGSISSFSSFEAVLREQPNNRTSLLGKAETILMQNMKSGSPVVLVKGVAWKTWHAFVYYCYTGIINFSSLRSQAATEVILQSLHCSPKSMYQLAKKLHNDALSQLALKAIETRLSPANILDEAFSKFTARHDDVREMEITLLVRHRSEPDVLRGLSAKIDAVADGKMPYAGPVLIAFCQRIAQVPGQNYPDSGNRSDQ